MTLYIDERSYVFKAGPNGKEVELPVVFVFDGRPPDGFHIMMVHPLTGTSTIMSKNEFESLPEDAFIGEIAWITS